jgi:hypothetical protein
MLACSSRSRGVSCADDRPLPLLDPDPDACLNGTAQPHVARVDAASCADGGTATGRRGTLACRACAGRAETRRSPSCSTSVARAGIVCRRAFAGVLGEVRLLAVDDDGASEDTRLPDVGVGAGRGANGERVSIGTAERASTAERVSAAERATVGSALPVSADGIVMESAGRGDNGLRAGAGSGAPAPEA